MKRRDFLKFVGVASSATVLSSCGVEKASDKIVSKLIPEKDIIPGEAYFKNSTCAECAAGCGVSVKTVDHNAIKLEGLASHPLNDGALCLRGQASLTRLYHPNRLTNPVVPRKSDLNLERMTGSVMEPVSWEDAFKMIAENLGGASANNTSNVYLSGRTTGSLSAMIDDFCGRTGVQRLPEYETYSYANIRTAYQALFGRNEVPDYKIADADLLITVGADVLETFVNPVGFAKQVEAARSNNDLKWTHFEPHVSLTGFKAGERQSVQPGGEAYLLLFLARYFDANSVTNRSMPAALKNSLPNVSDNDIAANTGLSVDELNQLAQNLASARNPLLIVGGVSTQQSNGYEAALLAGLVQWLSGMVGNTVDFAAGSDYSKVGSLKDIKNLVAMLDSKRVHAAFVTRMDPLFRTVPASMQVTDKIKNAAFKVAFVDTIDPADEKAYAEIYDLILPLSHAYESWGDVEVRKGLTSVVQPALKETIFDTHTEGDILMNIAAAVSGAAVEGTYEDWLKARWNASGATDYLMDAGYYQANVSDGRVALSGGAARAFSDANIAAASSGNTLYVVPSIRKLDGRSGDLQLMSEIPDPLSTVSYGSWVSVSKADADSLSFERAESLIQKYRDEVAVESAGVSMNLPAWVQPGLAQGIAVIQREQIDGSMLAYDDRTGEEYARIDNVNISRTGNVVPLAALAGGIEQGERSIIPQPGGGHGHHGKVHFEGDETLYPDPYDRYTEYRWGLSVDMDSCTGCGACVSACYIENNIPCVGEEEVFNGREMSWIRVQPYYNDQGGMDSLVMMCQQCDFAPCENVCPVYATYHNEEGLNVMVYNRCVGTRYCHNNCPYKVRRFNWFDWADEGYWDGPMARMQNPDIWVRPKGVMEKCTFCIQRIRVAKDHAKDEGRLVQDGEVLAACQQTCPTNAISFGNMLDKNSEVYTRTSQSEGKFRVLDILGTGPAVHYLRKEEEA